MITENIKEVEYVQKIDDLMDVERYLVNKRYFVPFDDTNEDYHKVQEWISAGGVVGQSSMISAAFDYEDARSDQENVIGRALYLDDENQNRIKFGANPIFEGQTDFDNWLASLYNNIDTGSMDIPNPPAEVRQFFFLPDQTVIRYVFSRFTDADIGNKVKWELKVYAKEDPSGVSIDVLNPDGTINYNSDIGTKIDDYYYIECPDDKATDAAEDLVFIFKNHDIAISGKNTYFATIESVDSTLKI